FLTDRYIAGTCSDAAYKFDDTRSDQRDKCAKLTNGVECIDTKCPICHSILSIRNSEHLFHVD
ncbi:unnamed protein product, partial [Rotaria sordida]